MNHTDDKAAAWANAFFSNRRHVPNFNAYQQVYHAALGYFLKLDNP